ncbi:MAG: tRNA uridine-5-carboxymethylaminomethyl(34) synthesis enzyme MnmG [Saprospiraceae bacterium]|nr:tRNA uridine-5-carboxymethylaminomethyl(34) synthesis enzyme MnmG [Saprospiraceae bacterium]MBK8448790.1 tRNA uridine-5-carboxymethylaminomethyl(34) synthesis enzyme MnmG [Saprospiraceae bacterium]MBK8485953.1 tRNA uridine-5-carboxymethylaminomethyl(34) synthesis enzyme MnmG [Saprospiraceae bacterium]MBK9726771.1 tRNA uridine-5-carboxymethylaminomethyl(34) synthesis enzyme MnmG [Saprospiraceae bacterium]
MFPNYDVIVVGAGHAGCEAAAGAANMGCRVLLITMNMQTIAQMSCNPAMGGVAKGQIVREIDAMGGYSGIVTDETRVQFRMLNRSKGPAMWSPRAQSDRNLFARKWRNLLEDHPLVDFWQDMVKGLLIKDKMVYGVLTGMGQEITAKTVVLTNGTFLNGIIHIGEKQFGGGRAGENAAKGITEQLVSVGFESGRMKTGTPPRLDGRSIDYNQTEIQEGDPVPSKFSFLDTKVPDKQLCCHITYTNPEVHAILRTGFDQSPMFAGRIQGLGPRYCPSIEDKIDRFADRDRHQLFIEPEGWDTHEIYINGFSSSLPEEIQYKALQKIPGLQNVKMFRPGYAIEYDYFPPTQLTLSLETHLVRNLFFAGQINGTTGYEEAACQGLMAGINAALRVKEKDPLILSRSEAYIGVLIDDLVNKGTEEPYRMFTSRAEYRILLRQDNADIRLTPISVATGMQNMEARNIRIEQKINAAATIKSFLQKVSIAPEEINGYLESISSSPIDTKMKFAQLVPRPNVALKDLCNFNEALASELSVFDDEIIESAEIQIKYEGYIKREQELVDKMSRLEGVKLYSNFDYHSIPALSNEAKTKLSKIKPSSIGQASRISGVSPSDISILLVYIGR